MPSLSPLCRFIASSSLTSHLRGWQEAEHAQADLEEAMPALEAAKEALGALTKNAVAEIKAFTKPPPLVELVMSAVMVLLKSEPTFAEAKRRLGDPGFLGLLVNYDKDNISDSMLKKVEKYSNDERFLPDVVGKQSIAARCLCLWVRAMVTVRPSCSDLYLSLYLCLSDPPVQYGYVYRNVAPKQEKLRQSTASLAKSQAALKQAQQTLTEIQEKLNQLKLQYEESIDTKNRLRKEAEDTERKLDRAEKLVSGLMGERERWKISIKQYEESIRCLVGDCLVAAAFLTYAGPFPSNYRTELVAAWLGRARELNIPHTAAFAFETFLSVPTQTREWNLQGLPTDGFSVQNGVLVTRGRRWPLMVDPQEQAKRWVRNMEAKRGLEEITLKMPSFLRTMENAIKFGKPVLLADVAEELDPALEPVLAKNVQKKGGQMIIKLGDKEIEFNADFRLYITSKLPNPHYAPEITTKTTIVNFNVKQQGLEQQLLGIVVGREKPELEKQKVG
jgi:dynein heavy chain